MIKFEHNNGELKSAVFGGNVSELCADLCVEIALVYGAIRGQDEEAAKEFKRNMVASMVVQDLADAIFNDDLYKSMKASERYAVGSVSIGDRAEFERQLKELLDEDE